MESKFFQLSNTNTEPPCMPDTELFIILVMFFYVSHILKGIFISFCSICDSFKVIGKIIVHWKIFYQFCHVKQNYMYQIILIIECYL